MWYSICYWFAQVKRSFLFNYHKAWAYREATFFEEFIAKFTDISVVFGVWQSEKFASSLIEYAEIPSLLVTRKPMMDTHGTSPWAFFCNHAFMQIPMDEREAAYMHEIGHLHARHFEHPENIRGGLLSGIGLELAADEFACQNGGSGGLLRLLERIRYRLSKILDSTDPIQNTVEVATVMFKINELDERILAVKLWIDEENGKGEEVCVSTAS